MRLWIGGEVQADIADEFRIVRNHLEKILKEGIANRDYGNGVVELAFIPMVLGELGPDWYKEIQRFHKRRRVAEFRLRIDHREFKAADRDGKAKLLFGALLRCLSILKEMDLPDFDCEALAKGLLSVARTNHWH